MNTLLITASIIIYLVTLILAHYNGYMSGFKDGFAKGYEVINDYTRKINHAQGETINNLRSELKKPPDKRNLHHVSDKSNA